jgi:hypothetical protein
MLSNALATVGPTVVLKTFLGRVPCSGNRSTYLATRYSRAIKEVKNVASEYLE